MIRSFIFRENFLIIQSVHHVTFILCYTVLYDFLAILTCDKSGVFKGLQRIRNCILEQKERIILWVRKNTVYYTRISMHDTGP